MATADCMITTIEEYNALRDSIIKRLEDLGDKYKVTFVLSVSMDAEELPDSVKKDVAIALESTVHNGR